MDTRKTPYRLRCLPAMSTAQKFFIALALCALTLFVLSAQTLFPLSAQQAFDAGERHFDARNQSQYDINAAEHFFRIAAEKDPTLPYLYHELARIDFLRGNFTAALSKINFQISLHGDSEPNSYYVRGLIEGYMGRYDDSIVDYKHYLQFDPHDWAAINDYCWVLLKANRPAEALAESSQGLVQFPGNAWLANTNTIALYEVGDLQAAELEAREALIATAAVTPTQWLIAYPGNDPGVAGEGVAALQQAARDNMHTILTALASSTVQSTHD